MVFDTSENDGMVLYAGTYILTITKRVLWYRTCRRKAVDIYIISTGFTITGPSERDFQNRKTHGSFRSYTCADANSRLQYTKKSWKLVPVDGM